MDPGVGAQFDPSFQPLPDRSGHAGRIGVAVAKRRALRTEETHLEGRSASRTTHLSSDDTLFPGAVSGGMVPLSDGAVDRPRGL